MSDKIFIDTNIFVHCFDDRQPDKKVRALALIADALQTGNGMISWQVIQEFLNVSTRELQNPNPEARYDTHESINLAFLAVLQLLPGWKSTMKILIL